MTQNPKSGSSEAPEVLSSIHAQGEIDDLVQKLVSQNETFTCRFQDGSSIKLQAMSLNDAHILCKAGPTETRQELASIYFQVDGAPYFAQSKLRSVNAGAVLLQVPGEVFRMQRRESYRIEIPEDYGAYLQMYSPVRQKVRVADLSGGGLQLIGPYGLLGNALRHGDMVKGDLIIGQGREPLPLELLIRRIVVRDGKCLIGLALVSNDQQTEMRVLHYVMEIYREVYSREKQKVGKNE